MPLIPTISIIIQRWEESEAGWGVRPDGYTIHLTHEDRDKFVDQFWKDQKKRLGEATPPEYTRTAGGPQEAKIIKNGTFHRKLLKEKDKHGIWGHPSSWPNTELVLEDPPPEKKAGKKQNEDAAPIGDCATTETQGPSATLSTPQPHMSIVFRLNAEDMYEADDVFRGFRAILHNMSATYDLTGGPPEPYTLNVLVEKGIKPQFNFRDCVTIFNYLDSLDCTIISITFRGKEILP